jgi:hypothetical protein
VVDPGIKMFFESLNQHLRTSKIASLTRFGKIVFCETHESVSQHAPHLLNHYKLPNAIDFVDDLHIFEVNLLLDLANVSFNLSLMPSLPSISALACGKNFRALIVRSLNLICALFTRSLDS